MLLLSGCGSMRNYQTEAQGAIDSANNGKLDAALATLESNNSSADKDLLYFLEKGQLLQIKNDLPNSSSAWLEADAKVHEWEETAKNSPDKLLGDVGSFIVNDKTRRYDGYDYEKVLLSTQLAMNHAAQGDWNNARVEVKKTHEREAIIADFRAKTYEKDAAQAEAKGVKTTFKDLKGYPVETLDDPEVIGLKNSYQNAFSHYLAAFVYEALGEKSLAAPGYRKAIELHPNTKVLEDALSQLDSKGAKRKKGGTDVLFVMSSGSAPARKSITIPLPIPNVGVTALSFPVIHVDKTRFTPDQMMLDDQSIPVSSIASIDAMSRRALRDDMPGIIVRTTVRAVGKGVAQKLAYDNLGLIGGLAMTIASVVTEQGDERAWRTLPAQISIARTTLSPGMHKIIVPTAQGQETIEFKVGGRYQLIPIRLMANQVYLSQGTVDDATQLAQETTEAQPEVAEPISTAKKSKTIKKSKRK